jgi:hypothetical protein
MFNYLWNAFLNWLISEAAVKSSKVRKRAAKALMMMTTTMAGMS